MNNTVVKQSGGPPNKVDTRQEINVPSATAMDNYYNKPGATTLHEVVESYHGGQMPQQNGVSSKPGSDEIGVAFLASINKRMIMPRSNRVKFTKPCLTKVINLTLMPLVKL